MPIRIREVNNISVLDLEGRIDINSSEVIETVGWLTSSGKINIILNLEGVDLVDYSGLSILAIAYKNVANHKGRLKFLHVSLPVIELLKVVRLESVFEIYSDEEAAVGSFYDDGIEKIHLRRRFARLDIHLKARYRMTGIQKDLKTFEGSVLNISAAGVYIYTPYTFPMNTMLELELTLPGMKSPLGTNGRVVWLPDKEIQAHSYPGMGVAFLHLDPAKEESIIDFIDKNITHRAEPI